MLPLFRKYNIEWCLLDGKSGRIAPPAKSYFVDPHVQVGPQRQITHEQFAFKVSISFLVLIDMQINGDTVGRDLLNFRKELHNSENHETAETKIFMV